MPCPPVCSYQVTICYPKPTSKPLYDGLVTQCRSLGIPFVSAEELAVSRWQNAAHERPCLHALLPIATACVCTPVAGAAAMGYLRPARKHRPRCAYPRRASTPLQPLMQATPPASKFDVVLDAMFGFSFQGTPRPPFDAILEASSWQPDLASSASGCLGRRC